jgi:hypothetical protein
MAEGIKITNKGNLSDYPLEAISGQYYTFTVRWHQDFTSSGSLFLITGDFGPLIEDGDSLPPGSHHRTFSLMVPDDGRTRLEVFIRVLIFHPDLPLCKDIDNLGDECVDILDKYRWHVTVIVDCEEGWDISLINLNKYEFRPAETVSGSLSYEIWNPYDCPACIQQLVIGIENNPKKCIYNDIPDKCPEKTTGTAAFSFPAPSEPGTYRIEVSNTYQYSCEDAKERYPQSNRRTIATIEVKEDACKKDSDGDGINDCDDRCPHEEENYNGYQDEDGCPDTPSDEDCDNGRDDDGDGRIDCEDSDCRDDPDCDPCKDVTCYPKCIECDYWEIDCIDGKCVKTTIIETNSSKCGCEDSCKDVTCSPECYDCGLWMTTCVDGECVKDYIIQENRGSCGPDCVGIAYELTDHWSGLKSIVTLIKYLYNKFTEPLTPEDALFIPPEIDFDIDVYISDESGISGVYLECSEPLGQYCDYMDLLKPDKNRFELTRVEKGHYRNLKPIRHCCNPLVDLVEWAIDKLCGGCFNAELPINPPSITASIAIVYEDGTILTQELDNKDTPLPTWYDAVWEAIGNYNYTIFIAESPIDLTVTDNKGRKIGSVYENGVFVKEINGIPNSFYSGKDSSPEIVLLPFSPGEYEIHVNGTETGNYNLKTVSVKDGKIDSKMNSKEISKGETHTYIKSINEIGNIEDQKNMNSFYSSLIMSLFFIIAFICIFLYLSLILIALRKLIHE